MPSNKLNNTSQRKKEHIELCLTDQVAFKAKSSGFENYDFKHFAITELKISEIELASGFFGKNVSYPFLISCMTGGTSEAENLNAMLAIAASELNIPIGVGSQRQLLENDNFLDSYKTIRKNAKNVPVIGNIGAAQVASGLSIDKLKYLIDVIEADAFAIHLNPLQEMVQKGGEPDFCGLLKAIEKLVVSQPGIPFIAKEVGAGISKKAAQMLLDAGIKGIDVSGAGGTSWSGVEILRNQKKGNSPEEDNLFWDWGLPTSYCIRKVKKLKNKYDFVLIGSGGINNGIDAAKALALGADFVASARLILQQLDKFGIDGVISLIHNWSDVVRKVMFLTGSKKLKDLKKNKLIKLGEMY